MYLQQATAADPNHYMNGPWKFTLSRQVYHSLLEHCPNRDVRWLLWKANVNRGSMIGNRELSTSLNTEEIRAVRKNIANVLGNL